MTRGQLYRSGGCLLALALMGFICYGLLPFHTPLPVSPHDVRRIWPPAEALTDSDVPDFGDRHEAVSPKLDDAILMHCHQSKASLSTRVVEIIVRNENGPIRNAAVTYWDGDQCSITDEEGRVVLGVALGAATGHVRISAPNFLTFDRRVRLDSTVMIKLSQPAVIKGSVLDDDTGRPVPGALVSVDDYGMLGTLPNPQRCDESGSFAIGAVAASARLTLVIQANEYADQRIGVTAPTSTPLEIRLLHGCQLPVATIDRSTGALLEGVMFQVGNSRYRSNELGLCSLPMPLRSGLPVQARARKAGYCAVNLDIDPTRCSYLTVRMPRAASIKGTVLDAAGSPIGGARVSAWQLENSESSETQSDVQPGCASTLTDIGYGEGSTATSVATATATVTNNDGQFTLSELMPSGVCTNINVRMPGYFAKPAVVMMAAEPGETVDIEIRMAKAEGVGTVTGLVRFNGQPAQGSIRWRSTKGPACGMASLDQAGGYLLTDVWAGEIELECVGPPNRDEVGSQGLPRYEAIRQVWLLDGSELRVDFSVDAKIISR